MSKVAACGVSERLCEAEVEDLDLTIRGDLDVGGLQIPMNDAAIVRQKGAEQGKGRARSPSRKRH